MRYKVLNQSLANPSELEKTTIILSRRNINMLIEIGKKGDTFDKILNRLIDYDIQISGKAQSKK